MTKQVQEQEQEQKQEQEQENREHSFQLLLTKCKKLDPSNFDSINVDDFNVKFVNTKRLAEVKSLVRRDIVRLIVEYMQEYPNISYCFHYGCDPCDSCKSPP